MEGGCYEIAWVRGLCSTVAVKGGRGDLLFRLDVPRKGALGSDGIDVTKGLGLSAELILLYPT